MIRGGRSRDSRRKPEAPTAAAASFAERETVKAILTTPDGQALTTTTEDGRVIVFMHDPQVRRLLEELVVLQERTAEALEALQAKP